MSMSKSTARNQTELLLNQLDLGVTGTIVVMICRMWDVNAATSRYLSTDFIKSDIEGNLMHCTARGNISHNFLHLKEGVVYSVKNFIVLPNKDEFRVLRYAEFMLEFDGDTIVWKSFVKSDGFHKKYYAPWPTAVQELDINYVTNIGRTTQTKAGSKTVDFYLAYCRVQQIRVTLWGGLGDMLNEKRTRHTGLYPVVLTAVSVKLYNNRLYLSSKSSTLIVDDEKIHVLKRLKTDDSLVAHFKEIPEPLNSLLDYSQSTTSRFRDQIKVYNDGTQPRYAQLWFFDTHNEVKHRLGAFIDNETGDGVVGTIVGSLIEMMDQNSSISKAFRMARDWCHSHTSVNVELRLLPREQIQDNTTHQLLQKLLP
ncbi:hypothetical protein Tco_1477057 [Tanacetum coccineum]